MTTEQSQRLVALCGQALYGDQWQSQLSRALHVDTRTVQRWASGKSCPKPGVWRDVHALLERNAAELRDCMLELETGVTVE